MNDYVFYPDKIIFERKISENLPCAAYSMHTHNAYELIYFLDGDATHVIEDRKYKLKKDDLIIIRPFRYHFIQIDAPARYERYDILFDAERHGIEAAALVPHDMELVNLSDNAMAQDIFKRCDFYRGRCDGESFEKLLTHLISELFYNIVSYARVASNEGSSLSPTISKALRYINENLCTLAGVEEIANRLFISEGYLFKLFRKELHQTPKRYIMEKRLLLAQKKIIAGEKPTLVCEQCGFGDYTTFYRNYLSFFGHSPSER